jgi:esterase/lipase superfamily enzyme
MSDFIMTVRAQRDDKTYRGEVAQDADFREVPLNATDVDASNAINRDDWYAKVIAGAKWENVQHQPRGDIVFVIHGYNVSTASTLTRHQLLRGDLEALGFKGIVVSFDWPMEEGAISYSADRHAAKLTAFRLVDEGIMELSTRQTPSFPINIHIVCHSTGAYVLREAFDDAEDNALPDASWTESQIVFMAGDVSASGMSDSDGIAEATYQHCARLTNYSNRFDEALGISDVKRLGTSPRVGRIGLPGDAPKKAVNVDCANYCNLLTTDSAIEAAESPKGLIGIKSHSWLFGNKVIAGDLFDTLIGTDRVLPPTRIELVPPLTSRLVLQRSGP